MRTTAFASILLTLLFILARHFAAAAKYGMPRKARADLAKHFKKRIRERYGIEVDDPLYAQLCNFIRKPKRAPGRSVMLFRESTSRGHWLINVAGTLVYVVYNNALHALCTALPEAALQRVLERPETIQDEDAVRRFLETMVETMVENRKT